jgi:hypothetical protein
VAFEKSIRCCGPSNVDISKKKQIRTIGVAVFLLRQVVEWSDGSDNNVSSALFYN